MCKRECGKKDCSCDADDYKVEWCKKHGVKHGDVTCKEKVYHRKVFKCEREVRRVHKWGGCVDEKHGGWHKIEAVPEDCPKDCDKHDHSHKKHNSHNDSSL